MSAKRRAVFLDRDGVLVVPEFRDGRSFAPRALEGFSLYDDAPIALASLKQAGFVLVVVTNQPDVGAGLMAEDILHEMHQRLSSALPVDAIKVCTHLAKDHCSCRKPLPGLLLSAAEEMGIDTRRSFMVGDRKSDVDAGRSAGCRTVFIDLGYVGEERPDNAHYTATTLSSAAQWILTAGDV